MNIIHYLNEISFTEILAYALFLLAAILLLIIVSTYITYHATKQRMKEKANPAARHINIKIGG